MHNIMSKKFSVISMIFQDRSHHEIGKPGLFGFSHCVVLPACSQIC